MRAFLELLEQAEKVLYDAVFDKRTPMRDRIRAAFAILDAAPPRDLPDLRARASDDGCA